MRLKYHFEQMELDDRVIAVPVGDHVSDFRGVIKMNETATRILELLENDTSEEEIVGVLEGEYDSSKEQVRADIHEFVSELRTRGLLEE